jgi:Sulfotransferase family
VNPYLFLVGCPRSGTTLLQRMLDHHPRLAVANDTHFIPHGVDKKAGELDPPLTPAIVERVRTYRRFHRLGISDEAVAAAASRGGTYSDFVRGLYDELARARGKPLAGDKTPSYVRQLPLLHALFPTARVVHIIRDGRDTALSALEWASETKGPGKLPLWRDEPVGVCALWWRRHVQTGRADGAQLGGLYREVRYESLVADAEGELWRVADFLGLEYTSEMADFHVGKTRSDPRLSAKHAWLPTTSGLREWRKDMAERDVVLFEALAGDLLDELGYERATSSVPARDAERADEVRRRFAEEAGGARPWPSARAKSGVG